MFLKKIHLRIISVAQFLDNNVKKSNIYKDITGKGTYKTACISQMILILFSCCSREKSEKPMKTRICSLAGSNLMVDIYTS